MNDKESVDSDNDLPLAPGPDAGTQVLDAAKLAHDQIERSIEMLRTFQTTISSEAQSLAMKTNDYTTTARRITPIFQKITDKHGNPRI